MCAQGMLLFAVQTTLVGESGAGVAYGALS